MKQKFIETAGGYYIRLLPQNYGILYREHDREKSCPTGPWRIEIDKGVDLDLAVEIFKLLHTTMIKWASVEQVLEHLNALLPSQPEGGAS